jgi:hypothetical protein
MSITVEKTKTTPSARLRPSFQSAVEAFARVTGRDTKLNVVIQGNEAKTDGKTIWLPMIEESLPELEADIKGFVNHEIAHCQHTDFSDVKRIKTNFHKYLLNFCEDVRIERLRAIEYPGTAKYFQDLNAKWGGITESRWNELPLIIRFMSSIRHVMEEGIERKSPPRVDPDFQNLFDAALPER